MNSNDLLFKQRPIDIFFMIIFGLLIFCSISGIYSQGNWDGEESKEIIEITTGDFTFTARVRGDVQGSPIFLLHGFPETSYMWKDLQKMLADNGYFTIAPNQRGYSIAARPQAKDKYSIDLLAKDVIGMADALGIDKFHLVGHDWGSAVGWYIVSHYPERIISWTGMSVPHLQAFSDAMQNDRSQHKASVYMRQFQIAVFPELILEAGNYKALRKVWEYSSEEEVGAYLEVFRQKGALSAALNWYRANYKPLLKMYDNEKKPKEMITVPTLFIWGRKDPAILESAVMRNKDYIEGEYSELFLDSGHWLIQESYQEVSKAIPDMLQKH